MKFLMNKIGLFFTISGAIVAIISLIFSIYFFTIKKSVLLNEYFHMIINLIELIVFISIALLSAKFIELKSYNKFWIVGVLFLILTLLRTFIT